MHQAGQVGRFLEPPRNAFTGLQYAVRQTGVAFGIEGHVQGARVQGVLDLEGLDNPHPPFLELRSARHAEKLEIDPLGVDVVGAVARGHRFLVGAAAFVVHFGFGRRRMFQSVEHVVGDGSVEDVGVGPGIADARPDHRLVHGGKVILADHNLAAGRDKQPRQHVGELVPVAAAGDDGDAAARLRLKGHAGERLDPVLVGQGHVLQGKRARDRFDRLGTVTLQGWIQHVGRLELFDQLPILDAGIGHALVIFQELFPRRGEVRIGGEHGDQRAEGEVAANDQIAADGIEKQRRERDQEVVGELHQELLPVQPVPDIEDARQAVREMGQGIGGRIVGMDVVDARHRFAYAPRQLARPLDPFLAQQIDLAL